MIRDNIKKYPTWARGITTDSKGANLLGGIRYFTTCVLWGADRIPLMYNNKGYSFLILSFSHFTGFLSGGGLC